MKKLRIVGWGIAAVVVCVAALLWWKSQRPQPSKEEEAHEAGRMEVLQQAQKNADVMVEEAAARSLPQFLATTGVIAADEARVAHIAALSQGVVEEVRTQLGARVEKGQALLVYDNVELGESVGEYQNLSAALQRAQAQEQVAGRALARSEALLKAEAISPREHELRQAEHQQAQADVASRRAEAARAEEKLHRFGLGDNEIRKMTVAGVSAHRTASHSTLRSPLSGVVTKYAAARGEVVARDKELFTVVDTGTVWALADVYEKDIAGISPGGTCGVTVSSYPNEVFRGTVTYLSDALDPASRTAKLRCVLPNPDGRLKLEMFATVTLPVREQHAAVTVPTTAIQEVNGEPVAFVQKDASHFEMRKVQLGVHGGEFTEIRQGVAPGEKVVSRGSFYLKSVLLREQIGGEE